MKRTAQGGFQLSGRAAGQNLFSRDGRRDVALREQPIARQPLRSGKLIALEGRMVGDR